MGRKIETFEHEACNKCARLIEGNCITCIEYSSPCGYYTASQKKIIKEFEDMIEYHQNNNSDAGRNGIIRNLQKELKYIKEFYNKPLKEVYSEDKARGKGGGGSKSDANNKTSLKQRMKDNRCLETKLNPEQRKEIQEATREWEKENGELPKLRPDDGFTRSNIDSYTGEVIEDVSKYPKRPRKKVKANRSI